MIAGVYAAHFLADTSMKYYPFSAVSHSKYAHSISSMVLMAPFISGYAGHVVAEEVVSGKDISSIVSDTDCKLSFVGRAGGWLIFYDRKGQELVLERSELVANIRLLPKHSESCR